MKKYTERELNTKIHTFLARKIEKLHSPQTPPRTLRDTQAEQSEMLGMLIVTKN